MLKDKQLHDRLGIPIQTLQNWKNSDTYTRLLYLYLINQGKDRFEQESKQVADFYKYELLTPKQFSQIVDENWERFELFKGYNPPSSNTLRNNDAEETLTAALSADGNSILLIRYGYAMSKKKETVLNEVNKMLDIVKEAAPHLPSLKIVYVSSTQSTPKYFDEIEQDIAMVNYAELYKEVSDKHLLIV